MTELLAAPAPLESQIEVVVLPVIPPDWNVPKHYLVAALACRAILDEARRPKKYTIVQIWRRRDCQKCRTRGFLADPLRLCDCASVHLLEAPRGD